MRTDSMVQKKINSILWALLCLIVFFSFCKVTASAETFEGENGWSYQAEGLTLTAENEKTGEKASVTLSADGVFWKNRDGLSMTDSSLFLEDGWIGKEGIEDFHLLYEGKTASGVAYSAMTPPSEAGSYTVRLVLYRVKYDSEGGWFSTEKMPFYQTSISSGNYEVKNHTDEEIRVGQNVKLSSDGYYQVGTVEELLYVVNYCGMDANIEITQDIVYNPISVDEYRQAASGSKTVYNWIPIGTESDPYTGTIRGNGHTIYGLANWDGLQYAGFIGVGKGCSIMDLTLSDCVFGGNWWDEAGRVGIFTGLLVLSSEDGHEIRYSNLNAYHSVSSGCVAGTLIGECKTVETNDITITKKTYAEKRNYLTLSNCTSESAMIARICGGGIMGKLNGGTVVTIADCLNTGKLESGECVGGILGETSGLWQRLVFFRCVNTGEMNCSVTNSRKMGGVIGYLNRRAAEGYDLSSLNGLLKTYREDDYDCYFNDIKFEYCFSLGIGNSNMAGGITGEVEPSYMASSLQGWLWAINCKGIQSCDTETAAFSTFPIIFSYDGEEYRYTNSAQDTCSGFGHFLGPVWKVTDGNTCGDTGKKSKNCIVCGVEAETEELPVHAHYACETHCEYCSAELTACKKHEYIYTANGNRITAYCTTCHKTESVWIEINGELAPETAVFWLCEGEADISIKKSAGWDNSFPLVRLVFKNSKGKVSYNTVPADPEEFGTVSLQAYTGKVITSEKAITSPIGISAYWHDWKYTSSGITLHASCTHCGASASVTMDADGAHAANQSAVRNGFKDYDYEVFIDNGWRGQKGIEDYCILYDGTSVAENYKTGKKCDAFRRPTDAGTYSARAVLLTNSLDPETVYLSTASVAFYISGVPFSQCDRKFYSSAEINKIFAENIPSKNSEGYYQVGTREELLFVLYSGVLDAKIDITADITMNPITVNDETGEVLCGSYDIFIWIPFGFYRTGENSYELNSNGFSGTIRGNGHTISGLYNVSNDSNMGFVGFGKGCTITDLTLENCVFSATYGCGAFVGLYATERPDGSLMTLSGLNAYHCHISSEDAAGGIIGMVYPSYNPMYGSDTGVPYPSSYLTDDCMERLYYAGGSIRESDLLKRNYFTIKNCVSGSSVTGDAAGGIIGDFMNATVYTVENCTNFGLVNGVSAGGILGRIDHRWQKLLLKSCSNAGKINLSCIRTAF